MTDRLSSIRQTLEAHGQEHLLRFHDELDPTRREALLDQLQEIDFIAMDELIATHVHSEQKAPALDDLEPAPYYPWDPAESAET